MLHQRRAASLSETSDDVDHARRQADIGQPVRHLQRRDWSLLGRLQHAGTTCGQRRRQLPGRHQQRIIPRDDLARDSDRFLERKAHGVVGDRIHISKNFCGEAAVVLEAGGYISDVIFRFDDRLAGVAGFQFRQHGGVLADLFGETEEHAAAFLGSRGRPRTIFKGGFGGGDGAVHVVGIGVRGLRDHFFAGGIVDRKSLVGLAVNPLAIDVELIGAYVGFHSAGHHGLLLFRAIAELRSAARASRPRPHFLLCGCRTRRRRMRPGQ